MAPSSPRRMAIAWPIPELPPVTRATLPCSPFMMSSWLGPGPGPGPAVTEKGGCLGHRADLAAAAGGHERGVPERRVTRRRPAVRAHVQIRVGDMVVAG